FAMFARLIQGAEYPGTPLTLDLRPSPSESETERRERQEHLIRLVLNDYAPDGRLLRPVKLLLPGGAVHTLNENGTVGLRLGVATSGRCTYQEATKEVMIHAAVCEFDQWGRLCAGYGIDR